MNHFELMAMMMVMMVMIRRVMKLKGDNNKIIFNIQWMFTLSR